MKGADSVVTPNLFVIGAPKCGTTSLHAYLATHPRISMTSVKEPQIFAGDDYRRRLPEYRRMLDPGAAVRGESSVVYSQYPRWPSVPERIREVASGSRFVYVLRDPVERAVAHYGQLVQDGKESRPLARALADFRREDSLYLCASRYATQIRRYLEHFEPDRLHVVDLERLSTDPAETMAGVFAFLGLPPAVDEGAFSTRLNTSADHRTPTRLGRLVRSSGLAGPTHRFGTRLRTALRPLLSRRRSRPQLPEDLAAELRAELADEVRWLRGWSGMAFPGWSL